MNKLIPLFLLVTITSRLTAQTVPATAPGTMPFGKIDKADLEMTACDFEKDANAEILFDKGDVYFDADYNLIFERHIRIKVFNDNGKDEANIRIEYSGGDRSEFLTNVQAETVNLNNGNIEVTKVDKKQLYTTPINKVRTALAFTFPNVKPGSVIEYKYTITTPYLDDFPDWYFQTGLPTRYSELDTNIPSVLYYKNLVMVNRPFVKNTDEVKSMANIPSLDDEPYMSSRRDNAERILYQLKSINAVGYSKGFSDSWQKVGEEEADFEDFGGQFKRKLAGEEDIINKAKALHSDNQKIAFIFNEVKNNMKWDETDEWYTNAGTSEAWVKKTGNSTEINLILNHLLQKAGIKSLPMLVSTRKNGKVNPGYPTRYQFNRAVAYVPVDSANFYILDATSRYNTYQEIPVTLLNCFGLYIDKDNKNYALVFLQKTSPAREVSLINAEIKPDGKMTGTAQFNSFSYNRIANITQYKTAGEDKYIKQLSNGDNGLKISALKFENMEIDTLPLTQSFNFSQDLTGSDESYIYFKPNLFFTNYHADFLSEHRYTDIDFGYMSNNTLNGLYKIPVGYKIDAMPKSVNMALPDNSIIFRRIVAEQEGAVLVRYSLVFKKSLYFKENYPDFHAFFKKLNEMLDEQVVLKKS